MDDSSTTVPDMHLTVRQLLENHTRGIDGNVNVQQPLYFDTEIPTIRDVTDVDAYKASLMERMKQVDKWVQEQQKVPKNDEKEPQKDSKDITPQE